MEWVGGKLIDSTRSLSITEAFNAQIHDRDIKDACYEILKENTPFTRHIINKALRLSKSEDKERGLK